MRLDYGTQLSPYPITLSIGTLKKPVLGEIATITFDRFSYYEFFIKMTPEVYYNEIKGDDGKVYWNSLTDKERECLSIYDVIIEDQKLQETYIEILNFFFIETVIFKEGLFLILINSELSDLENLSMDNVRGIISKKTFPQIINLIQQICCIEKKEESIEKLEFKNDVARKLYEKMMKAQQEEEKRSKKDLNLTIPNIISALSNNHPSLNYLNIWELNIFQLLDSFNRIQENSMFNINCMRVSVWGDEKKTFDPALWYKNNYDKR